MIHQIPKHLQADNLARAITAGCKTNEEIKQFHAKGWQCKRCKAEVIDFKCECETSPSPWEPI